MLKYKLAVLKEGFVFQITQQDKAVTKFLDRVGYFKASNGWIVKSQNSPEIRWDEKTIFVRGSNYKKDLRIDVTAYVSQNTANRAANEVDDAIAELVATVKHTERTLQSFRTHRFDEQAYRECYDSPWSNSERIIIIDR